MPSLVPFIALLLLCSSAVAQSVQTANTLALDDPSNMPAASVDDLAWIAGHWRASDAESVSEEVWSPPSGGTMIGTYKSIRDGKPALYEFIVLEQEGESVGIKLKHFNPDMSGWEAVDGYTHFPLVKLEPDAAYFSGLTYRRIDNETMETFVAVGGGAELSFRFTRVAASDE